MGGTQTGFGAVINRHSQGHDQRYFNTTFKDFHGTAHRDTAKETLEQLQAEFSQSAGGQTRPLDLQKTKTVSCLTGENYSKDPLSRTKRDP